MKEAWEQHRSGSQSGNRTASDDEIIAGVSLGRDTAHFGKQEPGQRAKPGTYTGAVQYRPDGSVVKSPAGEESPQYTESAERSSGKRRKGRDSKTGNPDGSNGGRDSKTGNPDGSNGGRDSKTGNPDGSNGGEN